jgi:hypothetical protein
MVEYTNQATDSYYTNSVPHYFGYFHFLLLDSDLTVSDKISAAYYDHLNIARDINLVDDRYIYFFFSAYYLYSTSSE